MRKCLGFVVFGLCLGLSSCLPVSRPRPPGYAVSTYEGPVAKDPVAIKIVNKNLEESARQVKELRYTKKD